MATPTLALSPLNDVRVAVYDRIRTDPATAGTTLAAEGGSAELPYLVVGPAYKGVGGTDPALGAQCVVQVEAYAAAHGGGSFAVSAMQQAVATALGRSPVTFDVVLADGTVAETSALTTLVEDDVLTPDLRDAPGDVVYAQRTVRYRFLITT